MTPVAVKLFLVVFVLFSNGQYVNNKVAEAHDAAACAKAIPAALARAVKEYAPQGVKAIEAGCALEVQGSEPAPTEEPEAPQPQRDQHQPSAVEKF
jgi:hypothetical protein